jgi:hypothetical protein
MQTIKVSELKVGMRIWRPRAPRIHKCAITGFGLAYGAGIVVVIGHYERIFFLLDALIEIVDPKFALML